MQFDLDEPSEFSVTAFTIHEKKKKTECGSAEGTG